MANRPLITEDSSSADLAPTIQRNVTMPPTVHSGAREEEEEAAKYKHDQLVISLLMVAVIITGSTDVVAGKIRAQPLGPYSGFVTAIANAIVYFIIYISACLYRYGRGFISKQQIKFVWSSSGEWRLLAIAGLCDVLGQILQFIGQPYVSVMVYQLMLQAQVPFTALWSATLMHVKYVAIELIGLLVVVLGSATAFMQLSKGGMANTNIPMATLVCLSTACTAMSFTLKEMVFRRYSAKYGDGLDIFVVNSGASVFSLCWSLPVSSFIEWLRQPVGFGERLEDGFFCLVADRPTELSSCQYATVTYFVYMSLNIFYNISVYALVAKHSALLTFVCMKLTAPLAAILSLVPWPLIGSSRIPSTEWLALAVILAGVFLFRHGNHVKDKVMADAHVGATDWMLCCFPMFHKKQYYQTLAEENEGKFDELDDKLETPLLADNVPRRSVSAPVRGRHSGKGGYVCPDGRRVCCPSQCNRMEMTLCRCEAPFIM
ncbi:hypothetical protein FOL47_009867 [Perkinsus chesapeaki]|uniref:Uncharacterized protein n=1 Tax=Perkinsus chesapeaki TaxID=330153 RepID=A0A7J6L5Z4_PERCH|nr:hypothetical protein FOL47_009867 [Perkinsus chesapeaki]